MIQRYYNAQAHIYAVKYDGTRRNKYLLKELVEYGNSLLRRPYKLSAEFNNRTMFIHLCGRNWIEDIKQIYKIGDYVVLDFTSIHIIAKYDAKSFEKKFKKINLKIIE